MVQDPESGEEGCESRQRSRYFVKLTVRACYNFTLILYRYAKNGRVKSDAVHSDLFVFGGNIFMPDQKHDYYIQTGENRQKHRMGGALSGRFDSRRNSFTPALPKTAHGFLRHFRDTPPGNDAGNVRGVRRQ
jgi:hypothetical protein